MEENCSRKGGDKCQEMIGEYGSNFTIINELTYHTEDFIIEESKYVNVY